MTIEPKEVGKTCKQAASCNRQENDNGLNAKPLTISIHYCNNNICPLRFILTNLASLKSNSIPYSRSLKKNQNV